MCRTDSRLRKKQQDKRNDPVAQLLQQRVPIETIKRQAVTRGEGDKRYTRPPDVTRIIDSYPSTHAPVTLASGHAAELTLSGQELNLDLSGYATSGDLHSPVTISASLDAMLALSGQALDLDTQTANRVWAGPASGAAAKPTFRALVLADIPDLSSLYAVPGELHDPVTLNGASEPALALTGQELKLTAYSNPSATADRLLKTGTGGLLTLDKLYLGSTSGDSNFAAAVDLQAIDKDIGVSRNSGNAAYVAHSYGGNFATFIGRSAGGTRGSESNSSSGTELVRFGGAGWGSGFPTTSRGYMSVYAAGAWSGSSHPTQLRFFTTPSSSTTPVARMRITENGLVFVNDDANANMTIGMTLNQGSNDDEIVAFKSSDVAHGMTGTTETDTYGLAAKSDAANGGLWWAGLTDAGDGPALRLAGYNGASLSTAKGTGARGAIALDAAIKSGSSITAVNSNGNLVVVRDNFTTRAIIDAEGELHLDATITENAWDDHDDVALLNGLRSMVLPRTHTAQQHLAQFVEYAKPILAETGVATFNEDSTFIAMKGALWLTIDAVRQVYERLDGRLKALEA